MKEDRTRALNQLAETPINRELGKGNHGPWTDFEILSDGMMNGKLSALRWALGDEWDMLAACLTEVFN
jgi:hypothetical protein